VGASAAGHGLPHGCALASISAGTIGDRYGTFNLPAVSCA
jgi:hypothetical protein